MAAARRPNLRPVPTPEEDRLASFIVLDPQTGERVGTFGELTQELTDQLAGSERDVRTWRARHAELLRDKEAEAEESPVWPAALEVFRYWQTQCRHPGSEWTLTAFELIRPHLERSNTGKGKAKKLTPELIARNVELCKLAVDGIAFDPYVTIGKNGRKLVHDGLHLVFGKSREGADYFEKRCKMAPAERIREVFGPNKGAANGSSNDGPARADDGSAAAGEQDSLWPSSAEARDEGGQADVPRGDH